MLPTYAQNDEEKSQNDEEKSQKDDKKDEKPKLKEKKKLDAQLPISIETQDKDSKKIDKKVLKLFRQPHEKPEFGLRALDAENKTSVYLYLDKKESISAIAPKIKIDGIADNIVVTKLSLQEMSELANFTAVTRIAAPDKAVFYTHLVGEGVSFTSANTFHAAGIDGTGVKVAIIDDSFFVTDPEIASNVNSAILFDSSNFCGGSITCGNLPGNSHGTAVAEIVVDMAPNVDLLLYAIGNSVDFDNAIDDAMSKGASIITASLGFPTAGGDGATGFFRDGTSIVAKKVNFAQSAGKLVTIAAGNEAQSHWMGNYVISSQSSATFGFPFSPYQSVLEFQPTASGKQKACLPITDNGSIYVMSWNSWATTANDYDIYLYDSTVTNRLAGSADDQAGFPGPPIEVFQGVGSGSACLVVASWSSSQNHLIHIDTEGNPVSTAFRVRAGSIGTPADATGALAVGAIRFSNDVLEGFSSSGPTDDERNKPEICGPDGMLSHQSGLNPFFGTSSATPHVAGAAALLLDENPSLTNIQLRNKLIADARFNPTYSVNNLCGADSGALFLALTPQMTCGVAFVSGAPINYGTIKPGLESMENILTIDNTGTGMASLVVSGTDWLDGSSNVKMTVDKTRFGTSSGLFSSKTPLGASTQTVTNNFDPLVNLNTFWQLLASPNDPMFVGQLTQTMTFTASC